MRSRLAAGLIALSFPLLGAASPAHTSTGLRVEHHYDDGGYDRGGYEEDDGYSDDGGGDGGYSEGHQGYSGGGGRSGDMDQDGNNNCRNFCFYGIPGPGGGERTQSLFPPTPEAVRDFVLATFKAGIEMGRLFSDTVITFVTNLFVGIA